MSNPLPAAAAEALKRKMQPATIVSKRLFARDRLGVFTIRPERGVPAYQAGQYLTLGMDTPAGFVPRAYSIASSPLDAESFELYVALVDGGRLTPHLFAAEPGAQVHLLSPKGHFTLAKAQRRTLVMVATGTGLAPFLSQVRTLWRMHQLGIPAGYRVILLHGCAHGDEFGYRDELLGYAAGAVDADFDFTYLGTASRPDPTHGWTNAVGVGRVNELFRHVFDLPIDARREVALPQGVDKVHLRNLIRDQPAALMVCGNPGMIDDLREPARQLGMGNFLVEEYWKA
jgi:ferredoxin-NADP reductase